MFNLSMPSSLQFELPDYKGDIKLIGGWAEDYAGTLYSQTKSALDPVLKAPAALEQGAVSYIEGGAKALYGAVGDTIAGAASAAGSTISSIWAPFSGGLKWAVGIAGVLIFLYVAALALPFLPKPAQR